ncbi:hypothetical protein [Palleronia caenipelagi]|uniref:hypothetical protein n=1 Tax=Palleronia caenipelagi TaxID=2489174 RepID=UPI001FEAF6AA|nr:hypothetical protein [Palleronia caenipelagi]
MALLSRFSAPALLGLACLMGATTAQSGNLELNLTGTPCFMGTGDVAVTVEVDNFTTATLNGRVIFEVAHHSYLKGDGKNFSLRPTDGITAQMSTRISSKHLRPYPGSPVGTMLLTVYAPDASGSNLLHPGFQRTIGLCPGSPPPPPTNRFRPAQKSGPTLTPLLK